MEKTNKSNINNRPESISYFDHEAQIARQEIHISRQHKIIISLSVALTISIIAGALACWYISKRFVDYLAEYDFVSYEQDGQGVNIIGDGNGVDYDGATSESTDQEEPFDSEG